VTGNPETAACVIRSLATSLSGLAWAQAVNLILVGFGSELESVAHVRVIASLSSVLAELRSTAELLAEAIGDTDPFAARVRQPGSDGWAPTIVCCASTMEPVERAELVRLAKPGNGVVAVINGDPEPSAWTIDVDSRPMAVQPLRLAVDPTLLQAEDLRQIGELYVVAGDDSGVTSEEPPYRDLDFTADRPPLTLAERLQRVDPVSAPVEAARPGGPILPVNGNGNTGRLSPRAAHPITVSILGTVEIDGASVFKRAKSKELAVYLALHPNGVGESELDEALWPSGHGRLVAPSTRDSTVSVARTALGGPTRLLPAHGHGREKRYQVSQDVGTDWSRFCQFHRDGRAAQDPGLLGQALELVRGRPFEGVIAGRTYGWVHTEGHARHIEAEVADAADLAARLLLDTGQAIDARWAARRGLMADPYVERLWVRLMEGADQLGDGQEIERIMDEMDVVLDLQGDFSGLHPHTLAAYDRLSRRRRLPS
jgi:DNA-binding SARP family transcriptional activator